MKHTVGALLLQNPNIQCDREDIVIRLKKAEALLYYLLVKKSVSRREVTGLLWGEENDETAHRHLRDTLYYLKKTVPANLIVAQGKSNLQLNPEVFFLIDVDQFLSTSDLDCYKSEFLTDYAPVNSREYEEWLERMRTSLRSEFLLRLDALAKEAAEQGQAERAEQYWQRYLEEEPYSEPIAISLMEFYRERSDYYRAALVYRRLYKALGDWLGIAPLKETSSLYYKIMEQWNSRAENETYRADDFLIGRQQLLQSLTAGFQRRPGSAKFSPSFVICGEAGTGKSHLMNYFLSHSSIPDYQIMTGSCFKSKREEYLLPWQSIMIALENYIAKGNIPVPPSYLQAAAGLFPVFDAAGTVNAEKQDTVFLSNVLSYESVLAILSLVSTEQPLLFVLEDIQWIGRISLMLLDQILHKIPPKQIAFAATCRLLENEDVMAFLRASQEDRLLRCYELPSFTREETMQFIDQFGVKGLPQKLKSRIWNYSGGNAFFLVQLLGSILERGAPDILPSSVEDIMTYRLAGLNTEGQQVLDLVAMFSDYAPYSALERISNKPTLDLLYICQELCGRSIISRVHDSGNLSFVFSQAEFRDLVYSRIDPIKRRILHLNIARVLAELAETDVPNLNTEIAYHYQQGGDERGAFRYKVKQVKAYAYLNCANLTGVPWDADRAPGLETQSMQMFDRMEKELGRLKKQYPNTELLDVSENELLYAKGCIGIYRGDYASGVKAIQSILDKPSLPDATRDLAHEQMTFYGIQTYQTDVMRRHIQAALVLTEQTDRSRYAVNQRYYGYLLVMEGQYKEGRAALRRSLALLQEEVPDHPQVKLQLGYAHNYIGEAYRKQGIYGKALAEYHKAISSIQEYPASNSLPVYYENCVMAAFAMGDYARARDYLREATEAISRLREPPKYSQPVFYLFSALFSYTDGDYDACVNSLKKADQLTDIFASPYDRGMSKLVKALLRLHSDQTDKGNETLRHFLSQPYQSYLNLSQELLAGRAGAFEARLQQELLRGKTSSVEDFRAR